jgi:hypothetical protein
MTMTYEERKEGSQPLGYYSTNLCYKLDEVPNITVTRTFSIRLK